jgi:hypothetical protein
MANGAFKFKDNSGNVVSFISGSGSNILFSGGTLDLSGMTGLTLGNLTLSGTTQNAISTSHAASYLLTSSFNTYSGTTDTVIGTLQTSTGSLNSFTSSTTSRLSSIEGVSGSYATTGSNQFKSDQVITGSLIVTGFIDAQELRTTYISSSILYRSGSTKFGDELSDTHVFTGSMLISGSVTTTGNLNVNDGYVLISTDKGVRFDTSGASGNPELSINSSAAFNFLNTAGLNSLTIANSRNVGVGVTPSTWNSNSRALQLPQFVSLSNQNNGSLNLMSFALETSAETFTYADTGVFPSRLNMNPNNGVIAFFNAGTGTSGNTITFNQRFTILNNGNVGIGIDSPTMTLSIRGDKQGDANEGQGQLLIDGTSAYNATNGSTLSASGAGGVIVFRGKWNSAGSYTGFAGIGGSKENTNDGDYGGNLRFYTRTNGANNPNEAMRITSGGNVGIGTTSPSVKLEVVGGEIKAGRVDSNEEGGQVSFGRASDNTTGWYIDSYGSTSTPALRFVDVSNGAVRMTITSGGVIRINNFTTNGLVGTDSSGNLGVVNTTYTEIAAGTITYSKYGNWPNGLTSVSIVRDYDVSNGWGTGDDQPGSNQDRGVVFDLGSAKAARRIVEFGYTTKNVNSYRVEYSSDNSSYTTIGIFPYAQGVNPKTFDFNHSGGVSARYWRLAIHSWTTRETQNYYMFEAIIYQ